MAGIFGLVSGFISTMPIAGPISILIFSRALEGRYRFCREISYGAAIVEGLYVFLAAMGVGVLFDRYQFIIPASNAFAALLLFTLGLIFIRNRKKARETLKDDRKDVGKGFVIGLSLSLVNVTLIVTWSAGLTAAYSAEIFTFSLANSLAFAIGVSIGIVLWFWALIALVARYKDRVGNAVLAGVQLFFGIVLIGLGGWFAARSISFFVG